MTAGNGTARSAERGPSDEPAWRRPERVFIALGMALDAGLWSFYLAAIVWWTVDLGLGPLRLVLLGVVLEVTVLLAEVPTGVLADRYSRKWSVVLSFLVMGAAMVLAVATTNYVVMLAAQAIFSVGWTFRSGAEVAWLTDEVAARSPGITPDVSGIILRRHRLSLMVGVLATVAAMAVGQWSLRGVVALAGGWLCLVGLVLAVAMTDHFRAGQKDAELYALKILKQGFDASRRVRSLKLLMGVMVLVGMGADALDRLALKQFLDDGDFGSDSLVFTGILFIVLAVLGMFVVWRVERSLETGVSLATLAMILLAVSSAGALVAAVAPVVGIALGMALQDPCREALDPVAQAWGNSYAPEESRATVLSFVGQAHGLGEVGGGLMLGSLAELTGIRWAILCAAVLWAAATLLSRLAVGEPPPADSSPAPATT